MATAKRVANKECRQRVAERLPFKGNNLEGVDLIHCYVVFSYKWYPLFIYCKKEGLWYENKEKYSVSTSRQKSQSHPRVPMTSLELKELK